MSEDIQPQPVAEEPAATPVADSADTTRPAAPAAPAPAPAAQAAPTAAVSAGNAQRQRASQLAQALRLELKKAVVGQNAVIDDVLTALLAGGHVLLEGVPGLGKTLLVRALAKCFGGEFARIQFTPDLMPSDVTGHAVYDLASEQFKLRKGPVFTHLLLADEINRAPAKTQAALLEVMQERQVTLEGRPLPVPQPFLVLATQNPIEQEGTYPLPEAELDRFMLKVLIDYPSEEEEFVIAQRALAPPEQVAAVASTEQLAALQKECRKVYVDPALIQYAVRLVAATRAPRQHGLPDLAGHIAYGASPRATIALAEGAQALAMLRARAYALPEDLLDLVPDVLRHRISLSYEALAEGLDADALIQRILNHLPPPARVLQHSAEEAAGAEARRA